VGVVVPIPPTLVVDVEKAAPKVTIVFSGGYSVTVSLNRTDVGDLRFDEGERGSVTARRVVSIVITSGSFGSCPNVCGPPSIHLCQ